MLPLFFLVLRFSVLSPPLLFYPPPPSLEAAKKSGGKWIPFDAPLLSFPLLLLPLPIFFPSSAVRSLASNRFPFSAQVPLYLFDVSLLQAVGVHSLFSTKRQKPSIYRSLLVVFFWRTFSATFPSPRPKRQGSTDSANIYQEEEGRGRRLPPRVRSRKRRSLLSLSLFLRPWRPLVFFRRRGRRRRRRARGSSASDSGLPPVFRSLFLRRPPVRIPQESLSGSNGAEEEREREKESKLFSPPLTFLPPHREERGCFAWERGGEGQYT